jgi:hypothetical protein
MMVAMTTQRLQEITIQAARWGADQQLKHCADWLDGFEAEGWAALQMCSDLRPKPTSLKEQALKALGPEPLPESNPTGEAYLNRSAIERHSIIRRALEALDD